MRGLALQVTPTQGNHLVCYCDDCQRFARHLDSAAPRLDEFGGTQIYQMAPAYVTLTSGLDHLALLKLARKGLHRWYASCCRTPVANTVSAKLPFAGVHRSFMQLDDASEVSEALGPIRARVMARHASTDPRPHVSEGKVHDGFSLGPTLLIMRRMMQWRLHGLQQPSPFYGADGRPVVKPEVLAP